MDKEQWIPVGRYDAVKANEYNNKFSIMQGTQGKNEVTYPLWACPQKWSNGQKTILKKNGEPVFVPWAISLGNDKEKAIKIAEAIVEQLRRL